MPIEDNNNDLGEVSDNEASASNEALEDNLSNIDKLNIKNDTEPQNTGE